MFTLSLERAAIKTLRRIGTRSHLNRIFSQCSNVNKDCKIDETLMEPNCKTAAITGGEGSIGFSIANELLRNKADNVILIGSDISKGKAAVEILNCSYGADKAAFFKCDVQLNSKVNDTLLNITSEFGKLDILINAAGIWDGCHWETEVNTNLIGTINTNLLALDYMNKPGFILNIAGLAGIQPLPAAPTLTAGYSGIIGLSRSLGHPNNFQQTGLRIAVLCLGITQTNFLRDVEKHAFNKLMEEELNSYLKTAYRQKAEACASSALIVIRYGLSGSVWVVEGSRLFLLNLPDWKKNRTLQAQFF